jgi:protease IV
MWKFVLGIAVGVVVTVVGSFIILFAIGRAFSHKQPTIAGDSVLVLTLDGDLPEAPSVDIPIPFVQAQTSPTVRDVWTALRAAATDNRIKAIVLQPRGIGAGWGKLQELRQELTNFKKSGKPVYAYLQSPGSREYYLASVADQIFVSPDDMLEVKGFLLQEMYFKNTLDKFGVTVQVDHIGKYKDAGDLFTKTNMSPETREVLNQVLDQLYGEFCAAVGQGRHKSADEIKTLVDAGPFLASQAKADGLIDALGYEDDVYGSLKRKLGLRDLNKVNFKSYFRAVPGKGDRIALLTGEGDIVRGDPDGASLGNQTAIASGAFAKVIRQVRNDSGVKGVILRVDSPGGDSVASDEILHELKLLSAAKPLVISMSDVAASGGYFISMTGDPVVSYPNTITGSIGVLYIRPNLRGLFDKLGVQMETLARGKMAGIDSVAEPLSDAAQQKLHDSILATYRSFVGKVATARKKNFGQIDSIAQGRVWMGTQARENGLVDELGGLDQAIALIRKKANLSASGDTNLVAYPPRRSLYEVLSNASPDALENSFAESRIRKQFPGLPSRALLEGGMLRMLPYRLSVQ